MKLTPTVLFFLATSGVEALENVSGDSKVERAVWEDTTEMKYKSP